MNNQTFLEKTIFSFGKTARTQEMKGIEKYGHELQPHENKYDWLEMAKEELVDGFKYLTAEQERRDKLVKEIESELVYVMQCDSFEKRCYLVNRIIAMLEKMRGNYQ